MAEKGPRGTNPTIKRVPVLKYVKNSSLKLIKAGENKKEAKVDSPTLKCRFVAWKILANWKSWVEKLRPAHQSIWKDAGIYEAIMSSTYGIQRHDYLILELASKWSPQTNTFAFPWGEATLTLEDVHYLGGFSASGLPALISVENDVELLRVSSQLELARKDIQKGKSRSVKLYNWLKRFMDSGNELEHEAFLSLWLTMSVFPVGPSYTVNKNVFTLAVKLSRGVKIALGPAVLAMLYRELTELAERLSDSTWSSSQLDLCAPFQLVQIWAWERFPLLKSIPNYMYSDEYYPRMARWSNVKVAKGIDLRSVLDSGEDAFLWCPYKNAVAVHGARDVESFGLYRKAGELVGFDSCIEKYLPQRVAKQFGHDQDFPTNTLSLQVKLENAIDYGPPPGFRRQIEVVNIDDSDSGDSCDDEDKLTIKELMNPTLSRTRPKKPFPSLPSADVAIEAQLTCSNEEKVGETERADKRQIVPLSVQIKGVDGRSSTLHSKQGESVCSIQDEIDAGSPALRNELVASSEAGSCSNRRSEEVGFDLEARISRLEEKVAWIKALRQQGV